MSMRGRLRKSLRADIYKINSKHGVHKVLLAFKGDVNSIVCLDMIMQLVLEQINNHGKTGFQLLVLNIDERNGIEEKLQQVRSFYEQKGTIINYKTVQVNSYLTGKSLKRIGIDKKFNILVKDESSHSMEDIINLIPNKSAVEDFKEVIYDQILLKQAEIEGCGTILYCNSMNKLSSSILANLIKGRGSNMNFKVNDTEKQGIYIKNPLRELFDSEIDYYSEVNEIGQLKFQNNAVISNINRNMTIKQITSRYLNQIEANGYASTIPTVVKITEKLVEPTKFKPIGNCKICDEVIYQNPKTWLNKITHNESAPLVDEIERDYAEQYLQAFPPIEDQLDVSNYTICYGCMVSMNGTESIVWPTERQRDQKVLEEFIIDSDDDE
ncbi:Cytoplasmic tRNA 2-thiolation protein 2 [Yamadazyma tenuis]|nr:Cytoplasmic tRNA 2-thiolation protein 2 [Yamadazyma tenuis]